MQCLFCGIAKKSIPSHKLFENKHAFAFLDKHPINPGHILVIPKKHRENFQDLDRKSYTELFLVVQRMAKRVEKQLKPKKVGVIIAGWDVPHAHVHVIPMKHYHDITSKSLIEGKRSNPDGKELEKMTKKLAPTTRKG